MTESEARSCVDELRELTVDASSDSEELIGKLRRGRVAAIAERVAALAVLPPVVNESEESAQWRDDQCMTLRRDLDRADLHFLAGQAERAGMAAETVAATLAAEQACARFESRCLAQTELDDVEALFDLVDLAAELDWRKDAEESARVDAEVSTRIPEVLKRPDRALNEARERWASLTTDEEDFDLRHRIHCLNRLATVFETMNARLRAGVTSGDGDADGSREEDEDAESERRRIAKHFRKLARRLRAQAGDRGLELRLEKVLTPTGAQWLEWSSLAALGLLLVLLLIEALVPLHPTTSRVLLTIDGAICLGFIAEYLLKLSLAPARLQWGMRHALTDLLPAIPAAIWLLPVSPVAGADSAGVVRFLRVLRITAMARYINALRPLLRLYRFVLFVVRGMDGIVMRFSSLLNRDFVFFERREMHRVTSQVSVDETEMELEETAFRSLRREHTLLADMERAHREPILRAHAEELRRRFSPGTDPDCLSCGLGAVRIRSTGRVTMLREVRIEDAILTLAGMQPDELLLTMRRRDLLALDQVVRIVNAPMVRWLPVLRKVRLSRDPETGELPDSPEARVSALSHRIAAWLQAWQDRALYLADLHGIVTGPQVLDRVATGLIKASQRPAVRLLMFGSGVLPAAGGPR